MKEPILNLGVGNIVEPCVPGTPTPKSVGIRWIGTTQTSWVAARVGRWVIIPDDHDSRCHSRTSGPKIYITVIEALPYVEYRLNQLVARRRRVTARRNGSIDELPIGASGAGEV